LLCIVLFVKIYLNYVLNYQKEEKYMADIKPFCAYRPRPGLEAKIAALPYDVYNREEACAVVKANPYSFLGIDRAETQFDFSVDTYDERVYAKAKEMLDGQIADGRFVREDKPCYYLYREIMDGRGQTGIAACASIEDYLNNTIKKHENTRADKEQDRINHVDVCNMQTGPIFLAYRENDVLNDITQKTMKKTPLYDFVSDDGIGHQVWVIDDEKDIDAVRGAFAGISAVYIADGHHRCASAVKVGLKRRQQHPDYTGQEEFNYFLAVLFPDKELKILDYNRVVKDLNGLDKSEFIKAVSESFDIEKCGKTPYAPPKKGSFGMYLDDEWYSLLAHKDIMSDDAVDGLDVSLLQKYLLGPILGIEDPKTDKRIDFVGGIRGLSELEKRVHTDMKVAFSMYPTSISELFAVADAGKLMPPKSTWFEPKLRSGLFLHSLD
jgi:uncharacterized protein (DUF1015 family)